MRQSRDSIAEQVYLSLIGKTIPINNSKDKVMIHLLLGESVGEFFFLMENLRTKEFHTRLASDLLLIVPVPKDPTLDNET